MNDTLTLKFGNSRAVLHPKRGALLSDLHLENSEGEAVSLLWLPSTFSGQGSGWPGGGMPILFPFAGRVFHESGLPAMPKHGFAHSLPWDVVEHDSTSAELQLAANSKTREFFPFDFLLSARYKLSAQELQLDFSVSVPHTSSQSEAMPFAFGLHPYFKVPFHALSSASAYSLKTSATQKLSITPEGRAGHREELTSPAMLPINEPDMDNAILGAHKHSQIVLLDTVTGQALRLEWPDTMRYIVLWTRPGEGFYCVEPWMGLPDAVTNGDGLGRLNPGERLEYAFRFALERT